MGALRIAATLLGVAAAACLGAAQVATTIAPEHAANVEEMRDVRVVKVDEDNVTVELEWRGKEIAFELRRARGVYSGQAADRQGEDAESTFTAKGSRRASVTLLPSGGVIGMFEDESGRLHDFGSRSSFERRLGPALAGVAESSRFLSQEATLEGGCGTPDTKKKSPGASLRAINDDAFLNPLVDIPRSDCYPGVEFMHTFELGLVLDSNFLDKFGDDARGVAEHMVTTASAIYTQFFNIRLVVRKIVLASAQAAADNAALQPFVQCTESVWTELQKVDAFTKGLEGTDKLGHWHLVGGCEYGNVVGVAAVGTVCRGSNVGLSVASKSTPLWLTFSHELGHGFGGEHSPESLYKLGGIMDYGSGYIRIPNEDGTMTDTRTYGFRVDTQKLMCANMRRMKESGCAYFPVRSSSGPTCGDGAIEGEEDCECPTLGDKNCGSCRNCRLAHKVECSASFYLPGSSGLAVMSESKCCSGSGKLMMPTHDCSDAQDGSAFCAQGKCVDLCTKKNDYLIACGTSADGCRQKCNLRRTNTANFCSEWWTFFDESGKRGYAGDLPDGTMCEKEGEKGMCQQGACTVAQAGPVRPATEAPTPLPSREPTTKAPSKAPTTPKPTRSPTASQTKSPTLAPTATPDGRIPLAVGDSCYRLSREECCRYKDGTPSRANYGSHCVPAVQGKRFYVWEGRDVVCQTEAFAASDGKAKVADMNWCASLVKEAGDGDQGQHHDS